VLPVALTLWLGRFEQRFVLTGLACLLGWSANTMIAPAYFLYLGTGRLRWTVLSHFVIGGLAVILGLLAGSLGGGLGVLCASTLALGLGSHVVSVAFRKEYKVRVRELLPWRSIALPVIGGGGILVSVAMARTAAAAGPLHFSLVTLLIALAVAASLAILSWRDVSGGSLFSMAREVLRGRA
jgi:hypothetical protein